MDLNRTAVYRYFDGDGVLLYVGLSVDPLGRNAGHRHKQPWFPDVADQRIVWYPSRKEACAEEERAINEERPLHNKLKISRPGSALSANTRGNKTTVFMNDAEWAIVQAAAERVGALTVGHYVRDAAVAKAKRAK